MNTQISITQTGLFFIPAQSKTEMSDVVKVVRL